MKSEALRNIRTMREVKTHAGITRGRLRATNSLSKTREEIEYLESLTDQRLEHVLQEERRRFGVQEALVNKSRERVLRAREKLAMTVNKNRCLTELKRKLQQARWEESAPVAPKAKMPAPEAKLRQVELKY